MERPDNLHNHALVAHALSCLRHDLLLFEGLGFMLRAGEVLQVRGPNGSGKTTLLRILCGLTMPESGEILWQGKNIHEQRGEYLQELSYIGHLNGIKMELTALENLVIAGALAASGDNLAYQAVLAKIGLADYENIPARKLSSGQRRRLALARLLITNTSVWILDEPFTALDDYGKQMIQDLLIEHAARGGVTILATHEPVDEQRCPVITLTL